MKGLIGIILGLTCLCSIQQARAQKYKDLAALVVEKRLPERQLLDTMLWFVSTHQPAPASAYLQIGHLYHQYAQKQEYLTHYTKVRSLLDSAHQFYELGQQWLEESGVKKHSHYLLALWDSLPPASRELSLVKMNELLTQKRANLEIYALQIAEVYAPYARGLEHYAEALRRYNQLHKRFPKQEDICLLSRVRYKQLTERLQQHIAHYVSDFDAFLKVRNKYSKEYYQQTYHLLPLEKYMPLEVKMPDFTQYKVNLWDLKGWMSHLETVRAKEVPVLRDSVLSIEISLNYRLSAVEIDSVLELGAYEIPAYTLEMLEKYDPESVLLDLFTYKHAKTELLQDFVKEYGFFQYKHAPDSTLHYYYLLGKGVQEADYLLQKVANNFDSLDFLRHENLFVHLYNAQGNLQTFLTKERKYLATCQRYCEIRIKDQLAFQNIERKYRAKFATYENARLPLFEQPLNAVAEPNAFVTTKVTKDTANNLYITGFQNTQHKQAFIAKVNERKVLWLLNLPERQSEQWGVSINVTNHKVFAVIQVYPIKKDGVSTQVLYQVDANGKVKRKTQLPEEITPSHILQNFRDSSLVYTASLPAQNRRGAGVYVENIGPNGKLLWKKELSGKGDVKAFFEWQDKYCLVGNYPKSSSGKETQVQGAYHSNEESGVYLTVLNLDGNLHKELYISEPKSHFVVKVILLSDQLLLIGFEGQNHLNNLEHLPVKYWVIDQDLQLLSLDQDQGEAWR
ncbi:hypothetical protein AAG747_15505 [Rapidithrix thailandica]|uniref:Uncharacterized protein n=1 Tax=Rapidithrix thailandica TaxID=413964 RepID=A0AAW9RWW7_9BACT